MNSQLSSQYIQEFQDLADTFRLVHFYYQTQRLFDIYQIDKIDIFLDKDEAPIRMHYKFKFHQPQVTTMSILSAFEINFGKIRNKTMVEFDAMIHMVLDNLGDFTLKKEDTLGDYLNLSENKKYLLCYTNFNLNEQLPIKIDKKVKI